jgi:penicillin amidase
MQAMQYDSTNINAEEQLPALMAAELNDAHLDEVRAILTAWDIQNTPDSAGAALFEAYWKHLVTLTFADDLPEDLPPGGGSQWMTVMKSLLATPDSPWWDDQSTPETEDMHTIIVRAFAAAVADLESRLGKDPTAWRWADLHQILYDHQVMSSFPIAPTIFNVGPFPVGGGSGITYAMNWGAANDDYSVSGSSPSFHFVADLGNLGNSTSIIPVGQSGHPASPHYDDFALPFTRDQATYPMLFDYDSVKADAEAILILTP